jgi:hypothetical protein
MVKVLPVHGEHKVETLEIRTAKSTRANRRKVVAAFGGRSDSTCVRWRTSLTVSASRSNGDTLIQAGADQLGAKDSFCSGGPANITETHHHDIQLSHGTTTQEGQHGRPA